jgi:hypothetical protein
MKAEPTWQERETALIWGVPLVLFSALAFVPIAVSLILEPIFPHARVLGILLVPVIGSAMAFGLARLAYCFRSDFDVITLFAGGTMVVLIVICMCAGVILASVVANL